MEWNFTEKTGAIEGYLKVVVVSDSHGFNEILDVIRNKHSDAYACVHCGDLEDNPDYYDGWVFVRGNNDYYGRFKENVSFKAGSHRVYVEHSHLCSYRGRKIALARKAKDKACDIALFGHTHCSDVDEEDGVLVLNPGSTWWPRDGKEPSYALLYIGQNDCLVNIIFKSDWQI
ncbi:MAG: YfcE family phosphodiesterase [Bacillota bacterium]|nr:YfcE family phosphodiesterase [Bacillota bacterium]